MSTQQDTPAALSPLKRALMAIEELQARLAAAEGRTNEPIAVIGMGCRFPGEADSPGDFWRLLASGSDAVTEVPEGRWPADAYYDADPAAVGRMNTRHGGFLRDIEGFDPAFFGLAPREVASMDPQHRLLLEVGWEALAAAGQLRDRLAGNPTGVFVGITTVEFGQLQLAAEGLGALDAYHITGNALNAAAGRLAYVFGLSGPCMAVDTACSSSLVAVHLACASLRAGECTSALAGGVNLILSPHGSIALAKGRVLSPGGRTRTFDADADGMVRGEGCGLLVLKRLADARRDGDRVLALIRGSGVNQDGPSSGLTVPNGPAQEALLRQVLASARVEPGAVGYVEAHGTGTALGDPIEVGAIGAVYGAGRPADDPLWIGSVKTNVGHLESAAGVVGLIKVILALQHEKIPAHLHFRRPSPHIPWDRWPLRVPKALTPWPRGPRARLAGVSAFGFSGTNAHVLVEEAPDTAQAGDTRGMAAPVCPFHRERFPLPRAAAPTAALPEEGVHSLLGREMILAGSDEIRFEATLSAGAPAFLADHRVFGRVVMPAAAWLEMALTAGRRFFGTGEVEVGEIEIHKALALSASAGRTVQTVVRATGEGTSEIRIYCGAAAGSASSSNPAKPGTSGGSSPAARPSWILHATAKARMGSAALETAEALAALRIRCAAERSVERLYADYAAGGLDYGPSFAAIRSLRTGVGEALAEIALPAAVGGEAFAFHPVLLDAGLQAAGAAWGVAPSGEVRLPVGAVSWRVAAPVTFTGGWIHARLRGKHDPADAVASAEVLADLAIFDSAGALVARLDGLRLQRARRAALERALGKSPEDFLYRLEWAEHAASPLAHDGEGGPRANTAAPAPASGAWLVTGDCGGAGEALAARLRTAGETVVTLEAGASAEEFVRRLAGESAWRGIVHIGTLDADSAGAACGRILALAQALASDGRSIPLWVVTRGAVPAAATVVRPAASAVWGLARVVMAEHPEWTCRLVDVETGADLAERLCRECTHPDAEDQVAWRGGRRLAARLARLTETRASGPSERGEAADATAVRGDGAYLITGGLGTLGLLTAGWLVGRGARHLILAGRHAPSQAAQAHIASWNRAGAQVKVRSVDVSDRAALAALLAEIAAGDAPLRGVVHGAGLLDDGVLRQQTRERFERVLAAKAAGAEVLDELTASAGLDFFILYSSSAALLGTPGQANYAAANAFLDGLAHRRRSAGRPALSVNWGPWTVGMAAGLGDRYAARGVGSIDPELGFAALERLLAADAAQAAVLPVDWGRYFAGAAGRIAPLFEQLKRGAGAPLPARFGGSAGAQPAAPYDPSQPPLEFLRAEAARVLRLDPARLEAKRSLAALGLDSLMAIELRNRLRAVAGVDLPVAVFLEGASLEQLAAEFGRRLAASKPADIPEPAPLASSIWPLTAGQEALWFLHQTDPGSPAYNTAFALRLRGDLDAAALDRVLAALVARHPLLRANFPRENGIPTLVVAGRGAAVLERVDAAGGTEAEFRERVAADYERPFDLAHGPLVRATLFRRGAGDHVLLVALHHIISDAWTNWLLLDEFSRIYTAERGGAAAVLAPLAATYADFGRWQRELAAGAEGERLWEYWRTRLAGELPVLALPVDRARPAVLAPRGAAVSLDLPAELMGRLRALAQARGTTPFVVLLASWQVFLHRHTGQDDLIVGAPTSGRSRAEFEPVAGYFVNPLPFRANLSGAPTFLEVVERGRTAVLEALAHADFPLPLLVERLGLPRDPSRSPLFQTLFVYQQAQVRETATRLKGLATEEFPLVQMAGQFELMLEVFEGAGASIKYHTDLFTADTANLLARRFRVLLEGIAANPAQSISALPLLDEPERLSVVRTWNATQADFPQERCLHALVAAQAARTPGAVAVAWEGGALTYAQLLERSCQLAHWLRRAGVRPDTLVGVCAERSPELVVALLGVLLAGGAYVPLDPSYPRERLASMREDSGLVLVLAQASLADAWAASGVRVLRLDAQWGEVARELSTPPVVGVAPDHLAYLIYTSGSTGRPKGAGNTHRAIVNRLLWMQDAYKLGADDRVLQKTPFSFDVSVWEFFWPLLAGARLVLARPGGHQDSRYIAELVAREGVTTMHFVPSMLQVFVGEPGLAACSALRQVFSSGEALPYELAERFLTRHRAQLHNLYGPTEAAVDVSFWRCELAGSRQIVPIGRPIARTQLYVLDGRGRPAPIGVAGELHLGGIGLARGYHRRPDLTAEKFIPDQFGPPGSRLYRTGDLARWLPDGAVEYLGRLDQQVKLRGFRIELGEIEAALGRLPGVREAVVRLWEDRPGDASLAAYWVAAAGAPPEAADLRRGLRAVLPEHMIPADFVRLAALPLSPNGKVDRRALPPPPRVAEAPGPEFAGPETETERRVAAIWSEVLGRSPIGVEDNFFDLGGHSLRLGQVQAQLQVHFSNPPAMVELFQHPTVHSLAARLDGREAGSAAGPGRAEKRSGRQAGRRDQRSRRQGQRSENGKPSP